ncbi:di/tricarboxylate transporter [Mesorhizobium sp. J18]|uniref:SLC13 family permease n=1 Tax=Mesorhizobium sp. J18 TaxID=935263 RepID=UPI001199CD0D|nr:SLC13 family permease [Mesorhizobium sp. J18]TWH00595.1 di/tricarboxylate transporter [Mesorhizobium sp. J18]
MTADQIFIFGLLGAVLALLVWGKIRYDLVAFGALVVAVLGGAVPAEKAFEGFGHDATIIVALVLIVSRAMINAGAVELIANYAISTTRPLPVHIGLMSITGAALSAIINNVAAIVILMSLDIEAAKKAGRSPSLSLMPLSYATILGGMITLIGTPSNIVIAQFRDRTLGDAYAMFDFAPVGLVCAVVGIAFVTAIGWRLIPEGKQQTPVGEPESDLFVAEAKVAEKSPVVGKTPAELYEEGDEKDVSILGLVRQGKRLPGFAAGTVIRKGDFLVLEGDPKSIEAFIGSNRLSMSTDEKQAGLTDKGMALVEAIVPEGARAVGRTAENMRLRYRQGVELLGVSRQGKRFRERVGRLTIQSGDVLLLLGPRDHVEDAAEWLGVLPLAERSHEVIQRRKALLAIGIFVLLIAAAALGFIALSIALSIAVAAYALLNIVGPRDIYESIEWPVIVLLGSLIPLGAAFEDAGGTQLITGAIIGQTEGLPVWVILAVVMAVTMILSDFLNSIVTVLIAAPIGVSVAQSLNVSPDPFLMAVAVAGTCGMLTPIGHKNNAIIMGPGGYRFGDYWRIGAPLEILMIAVGVPAILFFWPL